MSRKIYVDGKGFTTITGALAYLAVRRGKRLDSRRLRRLADREGVIAAGKGEAIRVSWKAPQPENGTGGTAAWEAASAGVRRPAPLLRYPPGEGPRYEWSRRWR